MAAFILSTRCTLPSRLRCTFTSKKCTVNVKRRNCELAMIKGRVYEVAEVRKQGLCQDDIGLSP